MAGWKCWHPHPPACVSPAPRGPEGPQPRGGDVIWRLGSSLASRVSPRGKPSHPQRGPPWRRARLQPASRPPDGVPITSQINHWQGALSQVCLSRRPTQDVDRRPSDPRAPVLRMNGLSCPGPSLPALWVCVSLRTPSVVTTCLCDLSDFSPGRGVTLSQLLSYREWTL